MARVAMDDTFGIFAVAAPGLEGLLAEELREIGFQGVEVLQGGVALQGGWQDVWRLNLESRIAGRVLVRVAEFRAMHLAQLDKRARRVDWAAWLPRGAGVKAEASCRRSRIYHDRAAAQRIARAIRDALGEPEEGAEVVSVRLRIEDDLATISLDTSGEPLHRRGHKEWVGKAPLRETMAAAFLRACGYSGAEPVVDPMCGSGTFLLEAAEIAAGLQPGRGRAFAFERLPGFDAQAFAAMTREGAEPAARFFGFDRDAGAVRGAQANAERAGVGRWCSFARQAVSDLAPPDGPPGLVMVNPPYGARIGNRKLLFGLYGALGETLRSRFAGWRVGLVTSDAGLAKATGLELEQGPQVAHGGLKVTLWQARVG